MTHPFSRRRCPARHRRRGSHPFRRQRRQRPLRRTRRSSLRAVYHMTPPSGWLCDPQRPVLPGRRVPALLPAFRRRTTARAAGTMRRRPTACRSPTTAMAMPLQPDFPVWSGSAVVDTANTAGFGAGAVDRLATQPTDGIRKYQEQYLYWSTDGGYTFTALPEPVIVNTDGRTATTPAEIDNAEWFRDPKIHWDAARSEWVCVIGRARYAAFYTSPNLRDWQLEIQLRLPEPRARRNRVPRPVRDDGRRRHAALGARREHGRLQHRAADDLRLLDGHLGRQSSSSPTTSHRSGSTGAGTGTPPSPGQRSRRPRRGGTRSAG